MCNIIKRISTLFHYHFHYYRKDFLKIKSALFILSSMRLDFCPFFEGNPIFFFSNMFHNSFLKLHVMNFLLDTITVFDQHAIGFDLKNDIDTLAVFILVPNNEKLFVRIHEITIFLYLA